jgi:hypothetical protein
MGNMPVGLIRNVGGGGGEREDREEEGGRLGR